MRNTFQDRDPLNIVYDMWRLHRDTIDSLYGNCTTRPGKSLFTKPVIHAKLIPYSGNMKLRILEYHNFL